MANTRNINQDTCTVCGLCAEVCPIKIMIKDSSNGISFHLDKLPLCMKCGQCMAICPTQSIVVEGLSYSRDFLETPDPIAKHMNLPYEQAVCRGCRGEKGAPAAEGFTGKCDVYKCTEKKGISFCCDCSDFPCDHLHPYADQAAVLPHNTKVFNLCLIKKMGLESWSQQRGKSVRETYFRG